MHWVDKVGGSEGPPSLKTGPVLKMSTSTDSSTLEDLKREQVQFAFIFIGMRIFLLLFILFGGAAPEVSGDQLPQPE